MSIQEAIVMTDEIRPTPSLNNENQVRHSLQDWLRVQLDIQNLEITSLHIPEETGMSNITMLFDIAYHSDSLSEQQTRELVCRLEPQGQMLTFPDYDLALQYDVMDSLADKNGIPVPPLFFSDFSGEVLGAPFYIMEKVDGLIPPDIPPYHMDGWLCEESPQSRAHLWWSGIDAMSRLHSTDSTVGRVANVIQQYEFPKSLEEQMVYWENYYQWAMEGHKNEHCELAMAWLKENMPADEPTSLCWGDARLANVIFSPDKKDVAALLDWEMVALGNPLQDVAWWIWMDEVFSHGLGCPRLEGFPERAETVSRWAEKTGLSTDNLHFYLVFAGWRFSMLLARMSLIRGDEDFLFESFASHYTIKVLNEVMVGAEVETAVE